MPWWGAAALLPRLSAALRECWEGHAFTYIWCCSYPPGTSEYNSMCWNDISSNGITSFFYDRCCDIYFGPNVRSLPAFWARKLELEFHGGVTIVLDQAPVQNQNRTYSWDPNGVVSNHLRRWTPLYGVVWEDRAARVLLNTRFLRSLRRLAGHPLLVLDIASGLGVNTIAAAKSGLVDMVVGIDADAKGVLQAKANVRRNGLKNAHILHFDVCNSSEAFELLLGEQVAIARKKRIRFDLVTMSGLHAPPRVIEKCAYELMFALGAPVASYLDSDQEFLGPHTYKYGKHPSFVDYASKRGFPALYKGKIDIGRLHGTDEVPFLPILPVHVWTYIGRDFSTSRPDGLQGALPSFA